MPKYAQLNDQSIVIGVSDLGKRGRVERPDMIEVETADPSLLGMKWNGETFEPGPAPERSPQLTRLAFMDRFTNAELVAIYTAAKSDVKAQIWLDKVKTAQEINLADTRTREALAMLEAGGLIGEGRADEISTP
jgi:hypothetical protein